MRVGHMPDSFSVIRKYCHRRGGSGRKRKEKRKYYHKKKNT